MIGTVALAVVLAGSAGPAWRTLVSGVEYAALPIGKPAPGGDGILHVVRIDPAKAELRAHMASEPLERARTAKEWVEAKGLVAAINLGMYQADMKSNVGYARKGAHVNSRGYNAYRSFLAFGPREAGLPRALLIDAEEPRARERLEAYETAIQNLRLIRAPGANVWQRQDERWTEAAIASDREGRILFLFTRTPFTMWELNRLLLDLPLGIRNAMHVEGGPEASLSIRAPGFELHLSGSYDGARPGRNASTSQWPIPNVVGVAAAPSGRRAERPAPARRGARAAPVR